MADGESENVNGITEQNSSAWSHEEDLKLLESVEEHLGNVAEVKNVFVKDILWDEVAFYGKSEHDVQKRWKTLTTKIRKFRTVKEILEDAKKKVADQKTRKKRKREESSSTQPKMPVSAYLLFCQEKRPRLAAKYPSLKSHELFAKMGRKWQKLSDERKERYKEIYRVNRQQYEQDLTQYFVEQHPEQSPPRCAFDLWSKENAAEIKKSRPDISERKLKKKLKKYWERLEEKAEWEKKAKKESERFRKKMKKKARD